MIKIAGSIFKFLNENSSAVLIVAVVLLVVSSFKQCQKSAEFKEQISELQKQRTEILQAYSDLAKEQRKVLEDVEKRLAEIDDKYKDKQDELITGIKALKEEYLVDETKVIEFLVKFDIIGGAK